MSEREQMRETIRLQIDAARETLYEVWCRDAVREYATTGEHGSSDEALESVPVPVPANNNDVDLHVAMLRAHVASIRTFVEKHGAKWEPHVRERWLVRAEEVEDRVSRLEPGDALRKAG